MTAWVAGSRASNGDFFLKSLKPVRGRPDLVKDKKEAHRFRLRPDAERASALLMCGFVELDSDPRWEVGLRIFDPVTSLTVADLEIVARVAAEDRKEAVRKARLKVEEAGILGGLRLRDRPTRARRYR